MACDLCGASAGTTLLTVGDYAVVRCTECRLVRTEPQPDDLAALYPDDYYSFQPPKPPSRRPGRGPLARRLVPGVPPGPPGDLLDVGCGSGAALLMLRAAGWKARGIETSAAAVRAAQQAGLDVTHGDLVGAGFEAGSFDCVRFWHSLEHMRSPGAELAEAYRLLRPGGMVMAGVPNFGSLLRRVAGTKWRPLDVPRHLWHFERGTLAAMLERSGFTIRELGSVSDSTALLWTIGVDSRWLWRAALPVEMALDAVGVGDALEVTALKAPRAAPGTPSDRPSASG